MRFLTDKIYHIYNRGVEKRNIFLDNSDYTRFIHDLYEFNDTAPAGRFDRIKNTVRDRISDNIKKRQLIVEILAFCLMPNHYHLIIKQLVDGGISDYIQKIGIGYTAIFNRKYERSGVLFQGKTKAVAVETEEQLIHLPYYIHLNPLDLIFPNQKEKGISDWKKAEEFLMQYRWSSHLDYCNIKNYPSVISKSLLFNIWKKTDNYKKDFQGWLQEKERNFSTISSVLID
mgnify:CR=1 FL=1